MPTHKIYNDIDAIETQEWLDAFEAIVEREGADRAQFILQALTNHAHRFGVQLSHLNTPYINTIAPQDEPTFAGDPYIERRIRSLIRWNALAMVMRANDNEDELGGHIATFASSATLYDVGFNHFFRGSNDSFGGDLIYYQGHSRSEERRVGKECRL